WSCAVTKAEKTDGRLSHIKELIAWRTSVGGGGGGHAARRGARQRAGLTPPPPPTHFHASGRRFTHNSSGQSKNPLTAITVSTAILQPDRYGATRPRSGSSRPSRARRGGKIALSIPAPEGERFGADRCSVLTMHPEPAFPGL